MNNYRHANSQSPTTRWSVVQLCLAISILVAAIATLVMLRSIALEPPLRLLKPSETILTSFSYLGDDYPQTWPLPPLEEVFMTRESTTHYALDTAVGIAEWNATLPSGGGLLYLGPHFSPFTVSIFHQMRCLNIIREILMAYHADNSPGAQIQRPNLAKHCMNYLRQMVLCRADTRLESVRAPKGRGLTVWDVTHSCWDWSVVYDAAEENWQEYIQSL